MKKKEKAKRYRGKISSKNKLNLYWRKHKKELNIENLIYIVSEIEYPLLRKRALIEFLIIENLNFANFYDMLDVAKDILGKDPNLKTQFWKECFTICNEHNLVELGETGESKAIKELFRRIEAGSISNRKALQILIFYFQRNTDTKVRIRLWKRIEKLGPNKGDLKYIMDLPGMYALPKILARVEKNLRRHNEKKTKRTIRKIEEFVKQIKKEQA